MGLLPPLSVNSKKVLKYLQDRKPNAVSPTDIGHAVGGWPRHSSWASPICKRLVERQLVERTDKGHYRAI